VRQQAPIGPPANHFPTPSVGAGLLLAPSADRVVAFAAVAASTSSPGATPSAVTSPATSPASRPPAGGGGVPLAALVGLVAGGVLVIGGIGWLFRRRTGS
jgi:hypothetical protein